MSVLNEEFVNKIQELLGDESSKFFESLNKSPKKAMTVNYPRLNNNKLEELVDFSISKIPEVDNGYYINDDIKIGKHILNHLGIIYSQEPSAMYPVEMLDIQKNDIVLDLCASPGGKSIQILEKLNGTGLLVSNEIVYNRAKILYENLNRMGFRNFVITCNSPNDYESTQLQFDKILIDAPCGGEGMFRRHNFDFQAYNNASIETNAKRQVSILNSIKDILKVGGKLVYSTCTYDVRENEEVVVNFLKENPEFKLINCSKLNQVTSPGVKIQGYDTIFCRRRYPHQFDGEGQFMALLEKCGIPDNETKEHLSKFSADGFTGIFKKDLEILRKDFSLYANYKELDLVKKNDNIFISPSTCINLDGLNVLSVGTLLGSIIKGNFKPSHNSFHSYPEIYKNHINLNQNQVDKYLQGLEIDLDNTTEGICVVKYNNIALGGGKLIKGKLKNYYPKELRN